MTAWRLYACTRADGPEIRRGRLPLGLVPDAVEWALAKGFETVLVELDRDAKPFHPGVVHHVCHDPDCPGGC